MLLLTAPHYAPVSVSVADVKPWFMEIMLFSGMTLNTTHKKSLISISGNTRLSLSCLLGSEAAFISIYFASMSYRELEDVFIVLVLSQVRLQ